MFDYIVADFSTAKFYEFNLSNFRHHLKKGKKLRKIYYVQNQVYVFHYKFKNIDRLIKIKKIGKFIKLDYIVKVENEFDEINLICDERFSFIENDDLKDIRDVKNSDNFLDSLKENIICFNHFLLTDKK